MGGLCPSGPAFRFRSVDVFRNYIFVIYAKNWKETATFWPIRLHFILNFVQATCEEHSAAKLDQMTSDEKMEMANLNQKYKDKFGFPFIICVRLNKKEAIFSGLRSRLYNDHDQELEKGINEVLKITELRIRDVIFDDSFKIMSRIWIFW